VIDMSGLLAGSLGFLAVIVLILLEVPIGLALGGVAFVGMYVMVGPQATYGVVGGSLYEFAANWSLSALPLFILMGAFLQHSGLASSIYRAARLWLSFLPGGLAIATNVAAAGFAATSGSSMATAATMARIAVPEMLKAGYDKSLAAGTVASAGTLGALIPPSILMILFGVLAEVSISKMLLAGILPGVLTLAVYVAMIVIRACLNPKIAPRSLDKEEKGQRWASLIPIWPLPVLFFGILGGIYGGFVTATEAAALGAFLAMLIALAFGQLSFSVLKNSIKTTMISTAQIFFVALGAVLFTRFLTLTGMSGAFTSLFLDLAVSPYLLLLAVSVMFIILGMFLDPLGVMLISIPIIIPIFTNLGMDLIWVGIIVVKYVEIGLLTPPIGFNVYVVKGVVGDEISIGTIFKGVGWFLFCEVIIMTIIILYPELTLFIPSQMN